MYDHVAIIYNPHSTHDAESVAKDFAREIASLHPELIATTHKGHGGEITAALVKKYTHPLIISASGDGGYNEIIQAAMTAQHDSRPVCMVLPAGNANDHSRTLQDGDDLAKLVLEHETKPLDVLKLQASDIEHYAHSYIGFGFTAQAGKDMNQSKKGGVEDVVNAVNSVVDTDYVTIRRRGFTRRYDSIICSNIGNMAKILTVNRESRADDGIFELSMIPHGVFFKKFATLLSMALGRGANHSSTRREYHFQLVKAAEVQCDGETASVPADTPVTITCEKHALDSIY